MKFSVDKYKVMNTRGNKLNYSCTLMDSKLTLTSQVKYLSVTVDSSAKVRSICRDGKDSKYIRVY